jgi:hypothetical protein
MTTSKDDYTSRTSSDEYGDGKEATVGVTIDGFADPTGEFPKRDYFYGSSVNEAARGIKVNSLSLKGGDLSVSMDLPIQKASIFPFNDVRESSSGHVWEIDDTPGGERILIKHRLGGGIELRADGSFSSSSPGARVTVTGGDDTVIVDGHCNLVYKGDATLTVSGDYNVNVGGNYNLDVAGSEKVNVRQASRTRIGTNRELVVAGDNDRRIAGYNNSLVLKESISSVKGDNKILTSGELEMCSDDIMLSAMNECIIRSSYMSTAATSLFMTGATGRIGGEDLHFNGKVFAGPLRELSRVNGTDVGGTNNPSLDATFYGTLAGKASEAVTAEFAQKADRAHSAHFAQGAATAAYADFASTAGNLSDGNSFVQGTETTHADWLSGAGTAHGISDIIAAHDANIPRFKMNHTFIIEPAAFCDTSESTLAALGMGAWAIRRVAIDQNNELLNQIKRTDNYDDVFAHTPTTAEIRSEFRNPQNRAKTSLINTLVAEGRLSTTWNSILPDSVKVGRVTGFGDSTPRFGYNVIGNNPMDNKSKRFRPS